MGWFFKKKTANKKDVPAEQQEPILDESKTDDELSQENGPVDNEESPTSNDIDAGLEKSSNNLFSKLSGVFSDKTEFDDDLFEELEDILISCDIGVEASLAMIETLREDTKSNKFTSPQQVVESLQTQATQILSHSETPWHFNLRPYIIMVVGVNGVGKTTTTAKIAGHFQRQGKKVMLAAADTFRAAATEQLIEWGRRLDIPVIHQDQGADAAAVAHDAFNAALARDCDILLIDTAGRLHTQTDLMDQLGKVQRVLQKIDTDAPHEVMQILDSTTGQNALSQLNHFKDSAEVSSICLTKLDGSAKGGIAISLSQTHKLPIRFIGIGEGLEDLKPFVAADFAKALIPDIES